MELTGGPSCTEAKLGLSWLCSLLMSFSCPANICCHPSPPPSLPPHHTLFSHTILPVFLLPLVSSSYVTLSLSLFLPALLNIYCSYSVMLPRCLLTFWWKSPAWNEMIACGGNLKMKRWTWGSHKTFQIARQGGKMRQRRNKYNSIWEVHLLYLYLASDQKGDTESNQITVLIEWLDLPLLRLHRKYVIK